MFEWIAGILEIEWLRTAGLSVIGFIAGSVLQPLWPELWKDVFESKKEKRERNREQDKETLEQLLELIRPNIEIDFLKYHGHNIVHQDSVTENLNAFADLDSVDREFIDCKLERQRRKLHSLVDDYTNKHSIWTWNLPDRPDLRKMTDSNRDNRPIRAEIERRRNELDNLADKTVSTFENLVRTARRRL